MKIVFMGTPEIAAVILEDMLQAGCDIAAVVTQPDKPKEGERNSAAPM